MEQIFGKIMKNPNDIRKGESNETEQGHPTSSNTLGQINEDNPDRTNVEPINPESDGNVNFSVGRDIIDEKEDVDCSIPSSAPDEQEGAKNIPLPPSHQNSFAYTPLSPHEKGDRSSGYFVHGGLPHGRQGLGDTVLDEGATMDRVIVQPPTGLAHKD
ncbi:uncharacterized protein I206_105024 [Kwoniella pini CBS 10737]|uniref:Uncharacterized protein n=1 Tax=Kwoniella pini CBS 10737 TaxID=1296096 RepID=A0A1B9I8F1_9TREE|nr:uncharacterized protein I206_02564 [Kwoniella pini CBS 10737]OCF51848.1 hypothetical protein I206_02564 [Kwoniella pini CBS 10737]